MLSAALKAEEDRVPAARSLHSTQHMEPCKGKGIPYWTVQMQCISGVQILKTEQRDYMFVQALCKEG